MNTPTIGIDLGTRFAQTAVYEPNKGVKIIPNRWGTLKTPSYVAITDEGLIVGEDAARLALSGADNIWWNMKRHVGSDWVARYAGKAYTPEDLLLALLCVLREDAEAFLKAFISSCVLAVPAHFSFAERGALAKAAQMAGFEKVRIVNEPTAASLAVGVGGRFLVLDFGAGTLDISVVEGERGVFQVVESEGRNDIGGVDIDRRLCAWLSKRLYGGSRTFDERKLSLILTEAEKIKIALSEAQTVQWPLPAGLSEGTPLTLEIRRDEFEKIIEPIMQEILKLVCRLWRRYEPTRLLLVGGSSRIPLLRKMLAKHVYEPEKLRMGAEEAVVVGTALYTFQGKERLLIDALTRSLGVMNSGGTFVTLLERGTPLPAEARRRFTARGFGALEVTAVQGEGKTRNLNRVLQTIKVDRVGDGEEVEIVFKVDSGGLLHIEVNREMQSYKKTIALDSDEIGMPPCDMRSEIRLREEMLGCLLDRMTPITRHKLQSFVNQIRLLKDEDSLIQWQGIELLDHTISELLQTVPK